MKTLILMRHAKTEVGSSELKDFDRQLIKKGLDDALKMALWIKKKYELIDVLLVSSAQRTKQTAAIVKEVCGGKLRLLDSLYHADANEILHQIHDSKKKTNVLIVVGHNPAMSNLASFLCNEYVELKPSDAAVFEFTSKDWEDKLSVISFKHHSVYKV